MMLKGTNVGELPDGRAIIERDCGCQYVEAFAPMIACDEHRYIVCGKCTELAEVTPFGVICRYCSFDLRAL
jgi:hypothetical protein